MLRRYALVVAALAAVCAPVVAAAQANAQFEGVDGFLLVRGGELYQPAHGLSEELEPGTRALPDLISAFRQYCLRARFMPQMIGFIDFPGQFDLDPRPITVATAGSQPFEVAGWHGGDVSMMIVNADDAPTGRQCTVTAATTANHPAQELFPAMNRVFGQPLHIGLTSSTRMAARMKASGRYGWRPMK